MTLKQGSKNKVFYQAEQGRGILGRRNNMRQGQEKHKGKGADLAEMPVRGGEWARGNQPKAPSATILGSVGGGWCHVRLERQV